MIDKELCKASISLSQLVRVSVCTYWGGLRGIIDDMGENLRNELEEIKTDNKVNVEGRGLVSIDDIDIDYDYDEHLYDYFNECFSDEVKGEYLTNALEKYGIIFHRLDFYKHEGEYNFANDSLDMLYEYDDEIKWQEKYPELIPYVQNYIDNVRVKSHDGYVSFEPTTIEEVEMNDTTYIYAILDKEGILDEVKKNVEEGIMNCYNNGYWDYDKSVLVLRGDDGKIDWDTKYGIDYENKTLYKIKD